MKKFEFSMEKVLEYSAHTQKNEKEILSGMRLRQGLMCEKLNRMMTKRQNIKAAYAKECAKGMTVTEIAAVLTYMQELQAQISAQQKTIDELNAQIDRQIKKVLKINRETRSMEILRDRQLSCYQTAARKENEHLLDEFVANRILTAQRG